jgi:hypothetical protein
MGASRHIQFEQELRGIRTLEDLLRAFPKIVELIGKEINYIEDRLPQSRESASGPLSAIAGIVRGAPTAGTGIIAWGQQSLGPGDNTITFDTPLSSAEYGVIPVLYADGALIEFDPSRPTGKTTAAFHYNSPQTAILFYFAIVRT